MTMFVAGSFAAVARRPDCTAPAQVVLLGVLSLWLLSAAAGLEAELLGFAAFLAAEIAILAAVLPTRERVTPVRWSVQAPLLVLALAAAVPWAVHAAGMYRLNRANGHEWHGDITMGTDHYAVQGALALALVVLPLLAACWPRGRRHLGIAAGVAAAYLGLVSSTHPSYDAALGTVWSYLAIAWGVGIALLSALPPLQERQLRGEVVEPQRAL
jgi:hypothetical protein